MSLYNLRLMLVLYSRRVSVSHLTLRTLIVHRHTTLIGSMANGSIRVTDAKTRPYEYNHVCTWPCIIQIYAIIPICHYVVDHTWCIPWWVEISECSRHPRGSLAIWRASLSYPSLFETYFDALRAQSIESLTCVVILRLPLIYSSRRISGLVPSAVHERVNITLSCYHCGS